MNPALAKLLEDTERAGRASEGAIAALLSYAGSDLPEEYLEFLRSTDGAEGPIGEYGFVRLYQTGDIPALNEEYRVPDFAPGLLLIGSNGGGSAFAIDTRSADLHTMDFVEVPFIPLDVDEIVFRAPSLIELLQHVASASEE